MTTPDGAACYFCLGEEADEEGMPLVRDCSCRGDSAGFVHFSCLVMYAEQKSKQADEGDTDAFTEPWEKCTNCKQPFMGQLSVDVASDFVSFAEATYGHEGSNMWDKMNVLAALRTKIEWKGISLSAHYYQWWIKRRKTSIWAGGLTCLKTVMSTNIIEGCVETMKHLYTSVWGCPRWISLKKVSRVKSHT